MQDSKPIYTCVQQTNITHSQNLLPMVESALKVCDIDIKDIDLFAVTEGPGSFTGLRIGMALVKGMATAFNTPCVGVSSLKALAKSVSLDGIVIPCFDARRNQVYCCAYDSYHLLLDDCCCDIYDIEKIIQDSKKNVFFVGDGSQLCYNIYENIENVKKHSVLMPCAAMGACLIAQEMEHTTHFSLSPSYLRLSQAERELKEKQL